VPIRQYKKAISDLLRRRRRFRRFRSWSHEDQRRLNFYRQFIEPGDVVFDVGANLGNRAKIFHRMGAVVVAVEPQAPCSEFLAKAFHQQPNFHLIRAALGAEPGEAEMFISPADTISSLSPQWIDAVQKSGRFADQQWNERQRIQIQTLDALVEQFGRPAFVKIDVEGFEDQVLAGLSVPVGGVSLEFTPEFIEGSLKCIDHLCSLGKPQFQLSFGESMEFSAPRWSSADEIKRRLAEAPSDAFGDVYAKFDLNKAA
jgi:FkbM family methyltransferase